MRRLRAIYGPGFYLIGVSASRSDRLRHLIENRRVSAEDADSLVRRDEDEDQEYEREDGRFVRPGQRTRDTFELADVFVNARDRWQVTRFLDLLFGNPFHTPTPEEHAMFMAYAASLRSADLSRQVGAVVLSSQGDVIGVGMNDVAAPGGGLYWPGPDDARDFVLGKDINEQRRNEFVLDTMKRCFPEASESDSELLKRGKALLRGSPIFDLTEFGRAVHAEMEALLSCARSGASPRGGMLACTTFPCHNCAKHIIAAGLARVVYVEPYPKSQAHDLFRDQIALEGMISKRELSEDGSKVLFSPFSGVGPRRYIDLFSLGLGSGNKVRRKKEAGVDKAEWKRHGARVRVQMLPNSYLDRERLAWEDLLREKTRYHERREKELQHREESEVLGGSREERSRSGDVARLEEGEGVDRTSGADEPARDG